MPPAAECGRWLTGHRSRRVVVATFLVLPPRELLEHAVNEFISSHFPGCETPPGLWERIVRDVTASAEETFVLHREDLLGDGLADSLVDGFGAEPGDTVREIDLPRNPGGARSRAWRLPAVPAGAMA
jgi:hypothetical protein